MKESQIRNELDKLCDKTILYDGKKRKLIRYNMINGNYVIYFDNMTLTVYPKEMEDFLFKISIFQNVMPLNNSLEINFDNQLIKETLIDSIKKVQEDKNYIPQADSLCRIISQYIGM